MSCGAETQGLLQSCVRKLWKGNGGACPGLRAAVFFQVEKLELDVREGKGGGAVLTIETEPFTKNVSDSGSCLLLL